MNELSAIGQGRRPRDRLVLPRSWFHFATLCCFFLPVLTLPKVNLVGELMLSDLTVLILLPIMLTSRRFNFRQPFLKLSLILLGLWLASAVASDLWNASPLHNAMRGWSKIAFLGLYIMTFMVLINGRVERYLAAILGIAVLQILTWIIGSSEYLQGSFFDPITWKYGTGFAVTVIAMLLAIRRWRSPRAQGLFVLLTSPLHLAFNARSLFLTVALSGLASFLTLRIRQRRQRVLLLVMGLAIAITIVPAGEIAYDRLARSGVFGEEALSKHLMQTEGGMGILLGGRSEITISLRAVADRPILGHGSWAESEYYYMRYLMLQEAAGRTINWSLIAQREGHMLIPSHSHLFGGWVEHGIFGGLFWIGMLIVMIRALGAGLFGMRTARSVEMLAIIWTIWNILFSPFGAEQRCFFAIYLTVATILIRNQGMPPEPQTSTYRST